jgi:hypothetical protein
MLRSGDRDVLDDTSGVPARWLASVHCSGSHRGCPWRAGGRSSSPDGDGHAASNGSAAVRRPARRREPLPRRGGGRGALSRLAEESGGRAFFVDDEADLAGVYSTIRAELGARYLLAYQSDGSPQDGLRRVEVAVDRPGVEARTIRGYHR